MLCLAGLAAVGACGEEDGRGAGPTSVTTGGDGDGDSDTETDSGWTNGNDAGPDPSGCAGLAQEMGWKAFVCDDGDGSCDGKGIESSDCALCCTGPSCGQLAAEEGWQNAACEKDGNGACAGNGDATWDCDHCCDGDEPDPGSLVFQYPVGDGVSYPAGGWNVWQVLGHYWDAYGGRHLAQDIAHAGGGVATVDAPVYAPADGIVRYAGPNGSSYKNVVLIEHDLGEGERICSFFGHVTSPIVETNQMVERGEQVTSVLDWALAVDGGASTNTHLHYVLLSGPLCDASAAANGSLVCGYDKGGPNAVDDLDTEPFSYTAIDDICGDHMYADAFISPTQFIEMHKQ